MAQPTNMRWQSFQNPPTVLDNPVGDCRQPAAGGKKTLPEQTYLTQFQTRHRKGSGLTLIAFGYVID